MSSFARTFQDDSTGAETNLPSCQSLENKDNTSTSSDTRQPKSRHFRQRSASDTTLATLHLGKLPFKNTPNLLYIKLRKIKANLALCRKVEIKLRSTTAKEYKQPTSGSVRRL